MTTQTSVAPENAGERPLQAGNALRSLADWGMHETGATTLGELIEEIRRSGEIQPYWEEVAGTPLRELATPSRSLIATLEAWTKGLPEAEQAVFWGRMTTRDMGKRPCGNWPARAECIPPQSRTGRPRSGRNSRRS